MANPVCLSPLKFYDSLDKQELNKSYAYGNVHPLIAKIYNLPPFQFIIPSQISSIDSLEIKLFEANTKVELYDLSYFFRNIASNDISIKTVGDYKALVYFGNVSLSRLFSMIEGLYYLKIASGNLAYYSEVFCFTSNVSNCLEIEYRNESGDFLLKNGFITFQDNFKFRIYLQTELGKPEYNFEEEATKRFGYSFIESQVSKKVYHFNAVAPEYICDALRIIRLCDNKLLKNKDEVYDMLTFDMDVEWQTQGDLASVNCEFEVDNIITNLGGLTPQN